MKIFKFPGGRIASIDKQNNKSPKVSQVKKCGSLDLTYFFQHRNKQLQRIYRVNSCQKKTRNKSNNSSKSHLQHKQQFKMYQNNYKIKNPKKDVGHLEKKIFLQTEKKGKYLYNDLKFSIELLSQRLARCLELKSQNIFTEEYKQTINFNAEDKQNNQFVLHTFIQKLCMCEERKFQNKLQAKQDKINMIEKQKISLNVEVKKMKIKQEAHNNQIDKLNSRIVQINRQLKKLKQKSVCSQFTQTDKPKCEILIQDYENNEAYKPDFAKLVQELRVLKEKQNHMNILVGQLRRDGLNIQRIYNKGLKYMKKSQNNSQYSSEEEQYTQYQNQNTKSHKNSGQQKKKIRNKNDSDADDSIIDEIQALSFNYEDKQNELEAYSPRRVYVCKKKIDENLKKKLELNFQCLYEYNDDYQDIHYNNSEGCPTI